MPVGFRQGRMRNCQEIDSSKLKKYSIIIFPLEQILHKIKLRKEMGNVSKRQQPYQRADSSRRPPMGLQCSEKLPH